ncbi:MAG: hypothetical protein U0414_32490 [Polyangiaceae bacterium]
MHVGTRWAARLLGLSIAASAAACAASKTPSPPPPDPPSPELSTPLTTAGSVKLPVYPPPVVPEVPPLGGPVEHGKPAKPLETQKARVMLETLRTVCAPGVATKDGEEVVGCTCAPPFELCAPSKDAMPVEAERVYTLDARLDGAFTASNATESALLFRGCESLTGTYCGALLVERADPKDPDRRDPLDPKTKLRKPDYRPGVFGSTCSTMKDDRGIDRLVCGRVDTRDAKVTHTVFVADFTKKGDDAWVPLVVASDTTREGCRAAKAGVEVVAQEIASTSTKDTNGDGRVDVLVSVNAQRGPTTPAFEAACAEVGAEGTQVLGSKLPPGKKLDLVYLQKKDGTFEPTAETKKLVESLAK